MIYALLGTIVLGIIGGHLFLDVSAKDTLDTILMTALDFMVLVAGIEIGSNRQLLQRICTPQNLALAVAIPVAIIIGSFVGGGISSVFTGLSLYDSLLVTAGLGWYSLSSVVVSTMHSTELGAISFLSNMLRETSAFILIPLLARWNKLMCIAPGGAGAMDSLLPLTIKATDMQTGMFSFISGLVLSLVVPLFLSLLLSWQ